MVIRDYKPADFQQVEKLWKETGIFTMGRGDTHEIIQRCNSQGGKFLIIEEPDSRLIAGTSWMTYDGRRLHLHHFAVSPSHQGRGLGRMLALESLKFAEKKGCPLKLEVHRDNLIAVNLYKSLGFIKFEDYEIFMVTDPGRHVDPGLSQGLNGGK